MKTCSVCRIEKPDEDFYKKHGRCKRCYLDILKSKRVPGEKRAYNLFHTRGITEQTYNEILERQSGVCAICGGGPPVNQRKKHFEVDHDHETGEVRGLLCHKCNRGLGLLGDNIASLEKAIKYLGLPL